MRSVGRMVSTKCYWVVSTKCDWVGSTKSDWMACTKCAWLDLDAVGPALGHAVVNRLPEAAQPVVRAMTQPAVAVTPPASYLLY